MPYSNRPPQRYHADDPDRRPDDRGDERDEASRYRREHHTRQSGQWGGDEPSYGRRYGNRPAESVGGGNPNHHGPQFEQGGQYPGTRGTGPLRYDWQDRALQRSQRITPKGYVRSDERVREDLCERLSRSGLDVSDVSVDVSDGTVTLEGTVPNRGTKHAIEDCADDCLGVSDIQNHIRVASHTHPGSTRME
ncbi:BON domain-containing protein [Bordetella sp. BOR01]|uniref:BON domain-containing protein n=1 Tax=Bordetella sp. BOR01 TaxID=2854779 RepID=UPI00210668CE|nr:BON domain-containing protein [Bordetella sp. BOR01]